MATAVFITAIPGVELLVSSTTIGEGNTITITCEAMGYPPPTVGWSRTNGVLSDRVSVSDNATGLTGDGFVSTVSVNLTITNASREDTAEYKCLANNDIGSNSSTIKITVESE